MPKPRLRVVPAPHYNWIWRCFAKLGLLAVRRFALEVQDANESSYRPYICGSSREIDGILCELEPSDGEIVYDVRWSVCSAFRHERRAA